MKKKVVITIVGVVVVLALGALWLNGRARLRRVPAPALQALRAPQEMIFYSIDPSRGARRDYPDTLFFHNFRILGQTTVTDRSTQKTIDGAIERAIGMVGFGEAIGMGEAFCFNPRHGVRVTRAGATFDYLFCYECSNLVIYSGEESIANLGFFGFPGRLNSVLQKSGLPVAK